MLHYPLALDPPWYLTIIVAVCFPVVPVAAMTMQQEFFDNASGGMTRLEGTHELFAVMVEWERQKVRGCYL